MSVIHADARPEGKVGYHHLPFTSAWFVAAGLFPPASVLTASQAPPISDAKCHLHLTSGITKRHLYLMSGIAKSRRTTTTYHCGRGIWALQYCNHADRIAILLVMLRCCTKNQPVPQIHRHHYKSNMIAFGMNLKSVKCYPGGRKIDLISSISDILSQMCYLCGQYTRRNLMSQISHC